MKSTLLALSALFAPLVASAADTAYAALRVIGKSNREALNRVVEVRGRNGSPQPDVWKVTVDDPQARGGIREYEVQRGKIIAQRTPTSRSFGGAMNFNQLNLDSDGLFTIVDQEAKKDGTVFSRLEFLLKSGTGGGAPVWEVDLFDGRKQAGRMIIAADSGSVLSRNAAHDSSEAERRPQDQTRYREPAPDRGEDRYSRERYAEDRNLPPPVSSGRYSERGEKFRSVDDFFHRLGKRFERRSDQLKKFFVGEDDYGRN